MKKEGRGRFLIKQGLIYRELIDLNKSSNDPTFKHYSIELKGDHQNVILGSIYRPPNTNLGRFMVEYKSSLDRLNNMKNKEIILGMDHNINFLKHDVHPKTL